MSYSGASTRVLAFMHTASKVGGVETWLDRLNTHLSGSGFELMVGLVRGERHNDPTRFKAVHPEFDSVEVDGRGLNREGRVRALVRCMRRSKPDIVLPLGIVDANEAAARCKMLGMDLRLAIHAQGNLPPMIADLALYRDWIDGVVCPGRLTSRLLREWAGFPSERVMTIANGADAPTHTRVDRIPGQPLRLGYVGRLTKRDKRVADLIELHRELAGLGIDCHLDIVGEGPSKDDLQFAFSKSPNVKMHGALSHAELYASVFPNLDALILTSSSEAFGIVLVEAMMNGVVPISSRYDGFHAEGLVEEDVNGLAFDVADMATAARQVARLARDETLLQRLSRQSLAKASAYTWSRALAGWQLALTGLMTRLPVRGEAIPALPRPRESRLDRMRMPANIADLLRRVRRRAFGSAVPPGGEEWPLFLKHHSDALLCEVRDAIKALDVAAGHEEYAPCARSHAGPLPT
jgi:glycosyltransferase involved in cell wall biosynthesis